MAVLVGVSLAVDDAVDVNVGVGVSLTVGVLEEVEV